MAKQCIYPIINIMLTIFTIPKPCINKHISIIQHNAIMSWSKLDPKPKIIVLGEGEGIAELASSVGATYLPAISTNKFGTPLLDSAFQMARRKAKTSTLMYTNADMIYLQNLMSTVEMVPHNNILAIGQRWDVDITHPLSFMYNWQNELTSIIEKNGQLHPPLGSDYFIYNRNTYIDIPSFAVGRIKWDNWMIAHAIKSHYSVIDATKTVTAIHQNHDYSHQIDNGKNYINNEESIINSNMAGRSHLFDIRDSQWYTENNALIKKNININAKICTWIKTQLA